MALSSTSTRRYWSPRCRGPWAVVTLYGGGRVYVRPAIVEATKALDAVLRSYNYKAYASQTGAYSCRPVAGTNSWSLHAYGIAIDINWRRNLYSYRLVTDMNLSMPADISRIRTNNGRQVWQWGGYWRKKDAMHFQICCTPADLATGINWKTVHGHSSGNIPKPPVVKPPPEPTFPIHGDDEGDEEDMRLFKDHNGTHWILSGMERRWASADEFRALKQTWMPVHDMGPGSPFYNPIVSQVILNKTTRI